MFTYYLLYYKQLVEQCKTRYLQKYKKVYAAFFMKTNIKKKNNKNIILKKNICLVKFEFLLIKKLIY